MCVALVFVLLVGVGSAANNTAPILDPITTVTISESETATIVLVASDPDNNSITYSKNVSFGTLIGNTFTWTTDYGDSGTYDIEFTVSDGNLTDTETGVINVGNTNRAPVLDPISTVQISETETATIVLTSSDPDGDDVTYSTNATFGTLSGDTFTWTTGHDDYGIYYLEFTVSDGNLDDTKVGIIEVGNTNRAPVLDPISTVQISETETATIILSSSDPDGDAPTYSTNATFGTLNGDTFTWTTGHDDYGIYYLEFTVSDGNLDDTKVGIIEVGNTNRAPVLDPISTVQISETETATIVLVASDPDNNSITYSKNVSFGTLLDNTFTWTTSYGDSGTYDIEFEVSDGNLTDTETGVINVGNTNRAPVLDPITTVQISESETATIVLIASDPDNNPLTYSKNVSFGTLIGNTFTWSTSYGDSGSYNIEFTVSDGNLTDTETGVINVGNTNRAPTLDSISTVQINETETAAIVLVASDPDGNPLTYSTNVSFGTLIGNTFTWTTDYGDSGTYDIEFTVSDGNLTDTKTGVINVGNTNRAPILDSISTVQISETETATIVLTSSDPDGDDVTYSTNATFGTLSGDTFTWTTGHDDYGMYYLEFTVSDGNLDDTKVGIIDVGNTNRAPILDSISTVTISETEIATIVLTSSDPDGDDVTYSTNATFGTLNGDTFTWTTGHEDYGIYYLEFTVSDGNLDDTKVGIIEVGNTNRAPVLGSISTVTISETETATIVLGASDPDGDTITYSTNATFGVLTKNIFNWTSGYDDYGIYYLEFIASDGNLDDTEIGAIVVGDADRAPVLDYIGDQSVNENSLLSFTVNASDPDGDTLTYSAVDLPMGATLNSSNGLFKWTPTYEQAGPPYHVIFEVTGKILEDSENVTITVNDVNTAVTSPDSGGGGGGGGGGSTGEEFDNIEVRDVIRAYISKDSTITYEFKEELNAIDFVRFDAKTSAGYIAATIEVLKDTSALVSTSPSGEVYQNMNIWIGNAGYATEDKIANPIIEFKVTRSWITENNIDISNIQLCRYSSGVWDTLPTTKKNEDEKYIYFTSKTPGFSPFAITGTQRSSTLIPNMLAENTPAAYFTTPSILTDDMTNSDEMKGEIDVPHEEAKSSRGLIFLLSSIGIIAIIIFMYLRRDSSWDMP